MGKLEKIQKELDLLLEKIRFWKNVFISVFSALIIAMFGVSQGKVVLNLFIIVLAILGVGIVVSVMRLKELHAKYYIFLDELEKE